MGEILVAIIIYNKQKTRRLLYYWDFIPENGKVGMNKSGALFEQENELFRFPIRIQR